MQGNILGQSGSLGSGLNVYAQLAEPNKKNGIWIKTAETIVDENTTLPSVSKYKYDKVELVEEINANETYRQLSNIPYNFENGSAIAIGTNIHLFGGGGGKTTAYKYNILTDTYTKLADIPTQFLGGSAIAVGTNIYLFVQRVLYKYDTLNNTYAQLATIPYEFQFGSAIAIETNIYLFGSANSSYYQYAYKFTITQLKDKTIFIETKQLFKVLLAKQLSIYFSNAYISTDTELLEYPVYYGDGTRWRRIDGKDDLQNLITEDGNQIITESGKIIKV